MGRIRSITIGEVFVAALIVVMTAAPGFAQTPAQAPPAQKESAQDRARELRAARTRFRHLTARAIASKRAVADLENRLARYGWMINSDLAAARVRMEEFMDDAEQDLKDGNAADAEDSMNYAEAAIERVEKLLGAR